MSTNEEIASLYSQYVMNTYAPSVTLVEEGAKQDTYSVGGQTIRLS